MNRQSSARLFSRAAIFLAMCPMGRATDALLLQDTYTNSASPTTNYGTSATNLKVSPTGPQTRSFLKFSTGTLPTGTTDAQVAKATLKLYVNTATTAGNVDIYRIGSSWGETALTWNNQSSLVTTFYGTAPLAGTVATKFVALDVTTLVQGWLNGTFVNEGIELRHGVAPSADMFFDSKENINEGHEPVLEIELTGPQGTEGPVGAQGIQGPAGPTGPQGVAGPTGSTGPQGPIGLAGKTWLSGTSAPSAGQGVDGDFYINTAASNYYGPKAAGSWGVARSLIGLTGAQGPQGVSGTAGKTWLSGTVAPTTGQGVDGDFYINTTTSSYYGPKSAGAWGSARSLVGVTGAQGPTGATGSSGPQGVQGPAGPTGATGATGSQGIVGATGPAGPVGPQGPLGPQGPVGAPTLRLLKRGDIDMGTFVTSNGPLPTQ